MTIFSIGTCRTQAALWETFPVFGDARFDYSMICHYPSEIIQMIKYLNSKARIDRTQYNTVFTNPAQCLMRKQQIQSKLNRAKKYIIEISSTKNLKKDGVFHNLNRVPKKDLSKYELYYDTAEDIIAKMEIMDSLLNHKPILFVPHINIDIPGKGFIKQRQLIQGAVEVGSKKLKQHYFDITDCVNRLGVDASLPTRKGKLDANHLKPKAVRCVKEQIKKFSSL